MVEKERYQKKKGFLILNKADARKERDFELDFLLSLSLNQRISMIEARSRELKSLLAENGHRETSAIIKGISFDEVWKNKIKAKFGKTEVYFPSLDDMIKMKKAAGRAIDREDLKYLRRIKLKTSPRK